MNVLSLFDGISCGQVALNKCGVKIDKYYAAEIDQRAISVTQRNWPKTIQFGSVTKIKSEHFMSPIHLLMGGSPCQGFSFAGKQLNFDDPRSKLFFEFVRLKNELKPTYFFLENVRMTKESQSVITELLGVEPVFVDSSLVCAATRKRLYWTNIPGFTMPSDRGILLQDILIEKGYPDEKKSLCLTANYKFNPSIRDYKRSQKQLIRTNSPLLAGIDEKITYHKQQRVYSDLGKAPNVDTQSGGGRGIKLAIDDNVYRKLSVVECERLQGLPDNYSRGTSQSARYHALGNGWQVDTIVEFFKHLPKDL